MSDDPVSGIQEGIKQVAELTAVLHALCTQTAAEKAMLAFAAKDAVLNLDRFSLTLKFSPLAEELDCSALNDAITSLKAALLEAAGVEI